jgi:hypothetical protein
MFTTCHSTASGGREAVLIGGWVSQTRCIGIILTHNEKCRWRRRTSGDQNVQCGAERSWLNISARCAWERSRSTLDSVNLLERGLVRQDCRRNAFESEMRGWADKYYARA